MIVGFGVLKKNRASNYKEKVIVMLEWIVTPPSPPSLFCISGAASYTQAFGHRMGAFFCNYCRVHAKLALYIM